MSTRWNEPITNPEWEQEFGSTVRVRNAVEGPLRDDLALPPIDDTEKTWYPPAERARMGILATANGHITSAVDELTQAVSWFGVVDRSDHADLVRQVELLADTIAYRLRNAGG